VHNAKQQEALLKSRASALHLILGSYSGRHLLRPVAWARSVLLGFYFVDYPFILAINTRKSPSLRLPEFSLDLMNGRARAYA
jgi:hypothetical protein